MLALICQFVELLKSSKFIYWFMVQWVSNSFSYTASKISLVNARLAFA